MNLTNINNYFSFFFAKPFVNYFVPNINRRYNSGIWVHLGCARGIGFGFTLDGVLIYWMILLNF
jgi:hypothetical protein